MSKEDFTLPPTHIERMDLEAQRQAHERELAKIEAGTKRALARSRWIEYLLKDFFPVAGGALLAAFLLFSLGYCGYRIETKPPAPPTQTDVELARIEKEREAACLARGRTWYPADVVDYQIGGDAGLCLPEDVSLNDVG